MKSKRIREIPEKYQKEFPSESWQTLKGFLNDYDPIIENSNLDYDYYLSLLTEYAQLIAKQIQSPCKFKPYHKADRDPYLRIGTEIFRPLIDFEKSTLQDMDILDEMESNLAKGENIILFANHQIEAEPQVLYLLMEKTHKRLAESIMCVAGARVLTDPLAVPFSLGFDMLSVYSKKYFESDPERVTEMKAHNQLTISSISKLLDIGGKIIFIAPAGGRDRLNKDGILQPSPFDPQSTELMYLLGRKSPSKTRFHPLATSTYHTLPPPDNTQKKLGEDRSTSKAAVHVHFGKEINMENFPISDRKERVKAKDARAQYIWSIVCELYKKFPN